MIVAVAMTMQKHEHATISTFTNLSIIYDAVSLDEAVGKAVLQASEEFKEFQILSIAKIEVNI